MPWGMRLGCASTAERWRPVRRTSELNLPTGQEIAVRVLRYSPGESRGERNAAGGQDVVDQEDFLRQTIGTYAPRLGSIRRQPSSTQTAHNVLR